MEEQKKGCSTSNQFPTENIATTVQQLMPSHDENSSEVEIVTGAVEEQDTENECNILAVEVLNGTQYIKYMQNGEVFYISYDDYRLFDEALRTNSQDQYSVEVHQSGTEMSGHETSQDEQSSMNSECNSVENVVGADALQVDNSSPSVGSEQESNVVFTPQQISTSNNAELVERIINTPAVPPTAETTLIASNLKLVNPIPQPQQVQRTIILPMNSNSTAPITVSVPIQAQNSPLLSEGASVVQSQQGGASVLIDTNTSLNGSNVRTTTPTSIINHALFAHPKVKAHSPVAGNSRFKSPRASTPSSLWHKTQTLNVAKSVLKQGVQQQQQQYAIVSNQAVSSVRLVKPQQQQPTSELQTLIYTPGTRQISVGGQVINKTTETRDAASANSSLIDNGTSDNSDKSVEQIQSPAVGKLVVNNVKCAASGDGPNQRINAELFQDQYGRPYVKLQNSEYILLPQRNISDGIIQNPVRVSKISGGGKNNSQDNATGIHSTGGTDQAASSPNQNLLSSRNWKHAENKYGPLERQSIHQNPTIKTGKNQSIILSLRSPLVSSQSSSGSGQISVSKRTPPANMKVLPGERVNCLCKNCGCASQNYVSCDACKKPLTPDCKWVIRSSIEVDKKKFYTSKLQQQQQKMTKAILNGGRLKNKSMAVRNEPAKPEMVTISSDEDEDNEDHSSVFSNTSVSNTSQNVDVSCMPSVGESPCSSRLPSMSESPCPSPPIQLNRRQRMEDQTGNIPCSKKPRLNAAKLTMNDADLVVTSAVASNPVCVFTCRSIRIGTANCSSNDFVSLDKFSCRFVITWENRNHRLLIKTDEIVKVEFCNARSFPSIALLLIPSATQKIRTAMKMKIGDQHWYDPDSPNQAHKRIIFILTNGLDTVQSNALALLNEIITEKRGQGKKILESVDADFMNHILYMTSGVDKLIASPQTPTIRTRLQTGASSASAESHLDSKSNSSVPMYKLFTYPPPPATGAITVTNEDLNCLNELEFLNDVIIDFYLKYFLMEKLSEEVRAKTHIFSSFFYKRLTQKPQKGKEDTNLSLMVRRHGRVKQWTRKVDIFSKDYLIIPINENAHWYLAIICFPSLMEPVVVSEVHPKEVECLLSVNPEISSSEVKEPLPPVVIAAAETAALEVKPEQPMETDQDDEEEEEENDPADEEEVDKLEESLSDDQMTDADTSLVSNEAVRTFRRASKRSCILIMDSLKCSLRCNVMKILRGYIQVEWDTKKATAEGARVFDNKTMFGYCANVPQQTNYSDCGIYVLQYVESFFENPITNFFFPLKGLEQWFALEKAQKKREYLRNLLLELQEKYGKKNAKGQNK
ncbi:uncharacterized protein LOC141911196 isoform X2 [Tubulanus polymorphus]